MPYVPSRSASNWPMFRLVSSALNANPAGMPAGAGGSTGVAAIVLMKATSCADMCSETTSRFRLAIADVTLGPSDRPATPDPAEMSMVNRNFGVPPVLR